VQLESSESSEAGFDKVVAPLGKWHEPRRYKKGKAIAQTTAFRGLAEVAIAPKPELD
jgi:hypothetical protein